MQTTFSIVTLMFASITLATTSQISASTIYTFPTEPSWFENVYVGANGKLVLSTISPNASVYVLHQPWNTSVEHALTKQTLPGLNGTLGLAEVREDIYAVAAGQFKNISQFVDGSAEMWIVDLIDSSNSKCIARMPEAGELNGMVAIPNSPDGDVLVADSSLGQIWKVSTVGKNAGAYKVWLKSDEMAIKSSQPERWPFGINGLQHSSTGTLYFTNTNTVTIWSIDTTKQTKPGQNMQVELVADLSGLAVALDDIALSKDGKAIYATSNKDNKLIAVHRVGRRWISKVILGGDGFAEVAGDTAASFGKTRYDRDSLYVVTSGRAWSGDNDTLKGPAKIVRLDLSEGRGYCSD
ncbi:Six-bladed beta-propeller, TolB-like protein [Akanthomyces lecanii RCEF 1005]|uniref:Six-bladed beta-propeller, TolB-like protein n=1 Tax=Akanthomyces lecanii RCEF 1005 TaxID=1081108 RepID=A0A167T322_CORDF|nr:Six-bladed beta-propeller, TolB-like protein [Akanthomyces lecanii RCEF 1005]